MALGEFLEKTKPSLFYIKLLDLNAKKSLQFAFQLEMAKRQIVFMHHDFFFMYFLKMESFVYCE